MQVERPIIIVGVGRSGSTAFHRAFSRHPEVAWLSAFNARFPDKPAYNRQLMQGLDVPGAEAMLRKRFKPAEAYPFWEHWINGFSLPFRDLTAADVTPRNKDRIRKALSQNLTARKQRLLIKITGWSRVGFLHEIFPDARFIHMMRDGRAVANSLINVPWWYGWQGPRNWRLGPLPAAYEAEWQAHGQSFVVLAGIYWKILQDAMEKAKQAVPADQFLELKYESLCDDPVAFFEEVVAFSELPTSASFDRFVAQSPFRNTNTKWQRDMTQQQQRDLHTVLASHLQAAGYLEPVGQVA